jgi:hypothetical protein
VRRVALPRWMLPCRTFYTGAMERLTAINDKEPWQVSELQRYTDLHAAALAQITELSNQYNILTNNVAESVTARQNESAMSSQRSGERESWNAWQAQQQAVAEQAAATAQAIIDANDRVIASTQAAAEVAIGNLTKSLIPDIGANAALQLNEELKGQLVELIGLYQQMGMPADLINYNVIDWLNGVADAEREAARGAAVNAAKRTPSPDLRVTLPRLVPDPSHHCEPWRGRYSQ